MSLVLLGVESFRLRLVAGLESEFGCAGYQRIAGVDEAGRGCLAGPVVAAAVVPHPESLIPGVTDSKLVGPAKRGVLAERIRTTALCWSVVAVAPRVIDRVNILEATKQAMRQALMNLRPRPEMALVDAVPLEVPGLLCLSLVRGDYISYAIGAASILAKVARDRIMTELDTEYPHYGFASHKGYAAPGHLEALREYGPTCEHRLTFRSVLPAIGCDGPSASERAHGC